MALPLPAPAPAGDERKEWKESEGDREVMRRWRARGGSLLSGDCWRPMESDSTGRPELEGCGEIRLGDREFRLRTMAMTRSCHSIDGLIRSQL